MQIFNSPLEAFLHWETNTPDAPFLNQPINGGIISYSFKDVGTEARKMASALHTYKLAQRSHIALLSKNCAHWHIADLAIMMAGHISIPIYPTLNSQSINQILVHSEAKAIIVGKLDDLESQKKGILDIPIISIGLYGNAVGDLWEDFLQSQEPLLVLPKHESNNLHTIIYTSGTTGDPKGVMHTVGNFMESVKGLITLFNLAEQSRLFSYLPIAHIAERLLETISLVLGAQVTFPESLDTFASDLEKTQPHAFFAVPRIWSKFQEKILEKLPQKRLSFLLKIPLLNGYLKKKLQQKLGLGSAQFILSGAAPLAPSLVIWFETIGISIQQVYGMTEDCCISHCNSPQANKVGSVGKPLEHVKVKLTTEGEICIMNNCLMKGYYKSPEATAAVFDGEGFLKTGDIGEYDHDGFLSITGRVKDQFKTDKGKYISPAPLELQMTKNTDIEQICIVGTGIPQPIALITVSQLGLMKDKANLISGLITTVNSLNPKFEKHEKIEKIIIMKEDWSVANGLITPTLKVKRNSIEKIHQQFYKDWFESDDIVIFE